MPSKACCFIFQAFNWVTLNTINYIIQLINHVVKPGATFSTDFNYSNKVVVKNNSTGMTRKCMLYCTVQVFTYYRH